MTPPQGSLVRAWPRAAAAWLGWLALAAAGAGAAPLTVANPSFEDTTGTTIFNEFSFGPPPGWELYQFGVDTNGGVGPTFFVGTLNPSITGSGGAGEYGLRQTLSATLQPNTVYTLQVAVINIASGTAVSGDFFDLSGFPGYRVDLLAGGSVLASDNNTLAIPEGGIATSTVTFTTGSTHLLLGQLLGIRLVNLNQDVPGSDLEVDFDLVRLDATPIPEPWPLGALATAAGLASLLRRRRPSTHRA